ncbi:hypothetical protein [Haloferula sargassicola]|uniref:PEP-CTERM sorting domain-containing protein n=1 Tax=Haloferula sargassicola TaxID=490096 RepID=A0ABP9UNJ4_9BACT
MKLITSSPSLALLLAALACPVGAATVAVNFGGTSFTAENIGAGENTATLDTVAGLDTPVWTNLDKDNNGSGILVTDGSNGFTVTYHRANGWSGGSQELTGSDASQQVFRGYLDDGDGGGSYANGDGYGVTLQLSGLSSYLSSVGASSYTLTVFLNTDQGEADAGLLDFELRQGLLSGGNIADLSLLQTVTPIVLGDGSEPTGVVGGIGGTGGVRGYATLSGLTENEITLAFAVNNGAHQRGSVSGFAITPVAVPEAASSLLGVFGSLLLLRRRRA